MGPKRILIISNWSIATVVANQLPPPAYELTSYASDYRQDPRLRDETLPISKAPPVDWSPSAVQQYLSGKKDYFDAVIVDFHERQTLAGIKAAGCGRPVIGLINHQTDVPRMEGSTRCVTLDMARPLALRETLDELLHVEHEERPA